ncbi:S1 RNA-binding domain-containing protein [Halorarum halophilum]|uniref:S1 RNA-binding domain-containing protein n=1 Tax=Halorarum halophilum TaxID=2743090 RepID=A0A7D5L2M0_9EURY|nr:OB-fold nucleic acid binding domain-containing protein [Halobaculum halophilum]QLG26723.1 S1 RNA-binding domain-containing protein [Halobaculum halophilum]
MGTCIICGTPVDGRICDSHEEDVVFEFRGNKPSQLVPNRFYSGTVDGYADFGLFVDLSSNVTGLLHRSELDQRLESLDLEPGDPVYVQVKNVRDNGDVDLAWSIRQSDREFRGALIQDGTEERDAEPDDEDDDGPGPVTHTPTKKDRGGDDDGESQGNGRSGGTGAETNGSSSRDTTEPSGTETTSTTEPEAEPASETADDSRDEDEGAEPTADRERVDIGSLGDRVGQDVRIEGEVVGARQTGGPTVFELRDETGVVDCAAFIEAGVRAYPSIDVGDIVRLDGQVERRRNEIQVETEALAALEGEEAETVQRRLADALTAEARPETVDTLADHDALEAMTDDLLDIAEALRRSVLESRPVVVRHAATADGYVAGAAVERAVLPLIREEHAASDAQYHYFTRRPLDEPVYDMDAATKDATRMLQDRDRHDEKLPFVLLLGTGSTVESADGLDLLGIYGAERAVVDAAAADPEIADSVETLANPDLAGADAGELSTGALAATLAATVNGDVRDDVAHLPAISYWEDTPEPYADLAADAGYDAERVAELREAVALEAFYQSYQDKRELITDILFSGDDGDLAGHISAQFREKLETELDTASANAESREAGDVPFTVLDADAYAHRYDFPPTSLLADALHRRERDEGTHVTLVYGTDELFLRASEDLDVREVAGDAAEDVTDAGVTAVGVREGRVEFLSGRREAVVDAVVDAVASQVA